jgi:hypothetical protein
MVYNIYLNSPQLAYNANKKKYYIYVINKNKQLSEKKINQYSPYYFRTSYNSIYNPNEEIKPY